MFVELATREDYVSILNALKEMNNDNGQFKVNELKAMERIAALLDSETAYILLAKTDDEIAGMFALEITSPWYSSEETLEEQFIYVRQPYRKTRAIFYLINEVKKLSQSLGNLPVIISIIAKKRALAKQRLFQQHFKNVGNKNVRR